MKQEEIQAIKQRFGIIGISPKLNRDIEVAVQVARTDLSVLVTGESGVGKEHFPKIIHQYSARKHGSYFAVNCGAIPEGTIESELFGHERGAFTDAKAERKGYFEIADGGTLFLDEVGELPIAMQAKLLRVLETGEYLRMGSSDVRKTDVRVVAATNLDMRRAIEGGQFREDLYYRLNTVEIHVPALRERKEDIALLFRKFSVDFSDHYQMPAIRLTEDAKTLLTDYYWRGNIRQLKNIAETVTLMENERSEVSAEVLRIYLPDNECQKNLVPITSRTGESTTLNEQFLLQMLNKLHDKMKDLQSQIDALKDGRTIISTNPNPAPSPIVIQPATKASDSETGIVEVQGEDVTDRAENISQELVHPNPATQLKKWQWESDAIRQALANNGGNRKAAAAEVGISERSLYRKIKDYGIEL